MPEDRQKKGPTPKRPKGGQKGIAIYHRMLADEDFETTADILHRMVMKTAHEHPGQRRTLILDIEGHRNEAGGFDDDAFELMKHFITGFLGPYLYEIRTPLVRSIRKGVQRDDVPHAVIITEAENRESTEALGLPVYDADAKEEEFQRERERKRGID